MRTILPGFKLFEVQVPDKKTMGKDEIRAKILEKTIQVSGYAAEMLDNPLYVVLQWDGTEGNEKFALVGCSPETEGAYPFYTPKEENARFKRTNVIMRQPALIHTIHTYMDWDKNNNYFLNGEYKVFTLEDGQQVKAIVFSLRGATSTKRVAYGGAKAQKEKGLQGNQNETQVASAAAAATQVVTPAASQPTEQTNAPVRPSAESLAHLGIPTPAQ